MTNDELMILQRRVLAGEPVSDEELRAALEATALLRVGAGTVAIASRSKAPAVQLGNLAEKFAAFKKAKVGGDHDADTTKQEDDSAGTAPAEPSTS